jgi:hypothetical protein
MATCPTYLNVCVFTASVLALYVTDTYDTNAGVSFVCSIPLQRFPFWEARLHSFAIHDYTLYDPRQAMNTYMLTTYNGPIHSTLTHRVLDHITFIRFFLSFKLFIATWDFPNHRRHLFYSQNLLI